MRRWSLLEFYALVVCLGTLVWFVTALYFLINGVVACNHPELTMNYWTYANHQTNDRYANNVVRSGGRSDSLIHRSEEAITADRERSWQVELQIERRDGRRGVGISLFGLIVRSVPVTLAYRSAGQARGP